MHEAVAVDQQVIDVEQEGVLAVRFAPDFAEEKRPGSDIETHIVERPSTREQKGCLLLRGKAVQRFIANLERRNLWQDAQVGPISAFVDDAAQHLVLGDHKVECPVETPGIDIACQVECDEDEATEP